MRRNRKRLSTAVKGPPRGQRPDTGIDKAQSDHHRGGPAYYPASGASNDTTLGDLSTSGPRFSHSNPKSKRWIIGPVYFARSTRQGRTSGYRTPGNRLLTWRKLVTGPRSSAPGGGRNGRSHDGPLPGRNTGGRRSGRRSRDQPGGSGATPRLRLPASKGARTMRTLRRAAACTPTVNNTKPARSGKMAHGHHKAIPQLRGHRLGRAGTQPGRSAANPVSYTTHCRRRTTRGATRTAPMHTAREAIRGLA